MYRFCFSSATTPSCTILASTHLFASGEGGGERGEEREGASREHPWVNRQRKGRSATHTRHTSALERPQVHSIGLGRAGKPLWSLSSLSPARLKEEGKGLEETRGGKAEESSWAIEGKGRSAAEKRLLRRGDFLQLRCTRSRQGSSSGNDAERTRNQAAVLTSSSSD